MSKSIYYGVFPARNLIGIYKYTSQWNHLKTVEYNREAEQFGWLFHGGKLYTMGGRESDSYSNKVKILYKQYVQRMSCT